MFKLTLNLDEDSDETTTYDPLNMVKEREQTNLVKYKTFIAKLNTIQKYKKGNKKNSINAKKYNNCPIKVIENSKSGASGVLDVNVAKKYLYRESYIVQSHFLGGTIFEKFYFPRLQNYCRDISKYIRRTRKMFPNNFLQIKDCKYCLYNSKPSGKKVAEQDVKISYQMENGSYKKKNSDNFSDEMEKKIYNDAQLSSLFIQIYYISIVCNKKNIFHNDLKAANIIINKAKKNFVYSGLGNLEISIKKGDLIPIFVDYDLISFKDFGFDDHPASGTSEDFNFFTMKLKIRELKVHNKFLDIFTTLPQYNEKIDKVLLRSIFKNYNIES